MTRTAIALLLLAAACGSKANTGSTGNTGGGGGASLSVTLGPADPELGIDATPTLAPADGAHFPAVSADGTTVVDLVLDAEDFSGIPIATVVFWNRSGVVASFQLVSEQAEEAPADRAQRDEATVAQINAKLAEWTWSPLDLVEATGESEDTGGHDTLDLGDGVTLHLSALADKFPAPGSLSQEMGGGGCGDVIGLSSGFGSRALGFAVVFPDVTLGGDDCFGSPSAQLAIVVPI